MLKSAKLRLYFLVARYFRFWAGIRLKRWSPKVVVVTGSAGKTTLLHLIEAQLGNKAHYSHHANSSFGIPFDILGLHAIEHSRLEWFGLFVLAPLALFKKPYKQEFYVAEVDADRPHEAQFLAELLRPDVTLWISALHSHTSGFDTAVAAGKFDNVREAVAYEYANLAVATKDLVVLDGDNELMASQMERIKSNAKPIKLDQLEEYKLTTTGTKFVFYGATYHVPALLPKNNFYQIAMVDELLTYLGSTPDYNYQHFVMPPGRSSTFEGIRGTTLFDSTYNNSNIDSLTSILQVFNDYPAEHKWAVVGDMLEQGKDEASEHAKIAKVLSEIDVERIILIGPRIAKSAAPKLKQLLPEETKLSVFTEPADVLSYLNANLHGGETVLFKGVRFLEGVIEPLLANKADADKLVRRGSLWDKRRAAWGLK